MPRDRRPVVALLGTMDTKHAEFAFVAEVLGERGVDALVVDAGLREPGGIGVDIANSEVAEAGGSSIEELLSRGDRGAAIRTMSAGAREIIVKRVLAGEVDGVFGVGGSGGTSLAAAAFRALPVGVPKVLVSTVAASDVSSIVGTSDLILVPSIVDLAGVNQISRIVLSNAANAVAGMVQHRASQDDAAGVPHIGVSMFANTMLAEQAIAGRLGDAFELIPFHATHTGCEVLEALAVDGLLNGVIDLTISGLASELLGGAWATGPDRLRVWADRGIPVVVAPGALDMAVFGPVGTLPEHLRDRRRYEHNADTTLVAITADEAKRLGRTVGERLRGAERSCAVCVPLGGFSEMGQPGGPFHDADITHGFSEGLRETATVRVVEVRGHINEPEFAAAVAEEFGRIFSTRG